MVLTVAHFVYDSAPVKYHAFDKNLKDMKKKNLNKLKMKRPHYILLFMVVLVPVKHFL